MDQSVPKETSEILANIQDESEAYEVNHVNYSPDIIPPTPPVPKPRTRTPVKTDHKPVETSSAMQETGDKGLLSSYIYCV